MEWLKSNWLGMIVGAVVATAALFLAGKAHAADLGGNCCADLEERIAELEAITAHKGNRKQSLVISGRINKAFVYVDHDEFSDNWVADNSNAPSYMQLAGQAQIGDGLSGGYVLRIGVGGFDNTFINGGTDGLYVDLAYAWIKGAVGQFSIGTLNQATDGIMDATLSNSSVASTKLSLRPLVGPLNGDALDLFDGQAAPGVRYDSPVMSGMQISASWVPATTDSNGDVDGGAVDVAVRGFWELDQLQVAVALGYRDGIVVTAIPAVLGDVQVISGSVALKHMPSGLFVNGGAGQMEIDDWAAGAPTITGYALQGGVEKNFTKMGDTTLFIEWGQLDYEGSEDAAYYGGGVVQAIDGLATKLYVSGRSYDAPDLLGDDKALVVMGGMLVDF